MINNFKDMKIKKGDVFKSKGELFTFEGYEVSKNGHGVYLLGKSCSEGRTICFIDKIYIDFNLNM